MNLAQLDTLLQSGSFHHATYRNFGTLWEGLHIYTKQDNGFNGFTHAGCFFKDDADINTAHDRVRHTGVSVGARGEG